MRTSKWAVVLVIMALVAVACGDSGGGSDTTAEGGTDTTGASSEFQLREDAEGNQVEIPQTDEMQDTSAYVTEAPWTIGYADASLSNSARVFVNNFTEW